MRSCLIKILKTTPIKSVAEVIIVSKKFTNVLFLVLNYKNWDKDYY